MPLPQMQYTSPLSGGVYTRASLSATWTKIANISDADNYWVDTGSGRAVAVSYTNIARIYTSEDGVTWTIRPQSEDFRGSVNYMKSPVNLFRLNGYFFAIFGKSIAMSQDGISWTSTLQINDSSSWVAAGFVNGKWFLIKDDGRTYTRSALDAAGNAQSPIIGFFAWTNNGISNTLANTQKIGWAASNPDNTVALAVSRDGILNRSTDGSSWTRVRTGLNSSVSLKKVAHLGGYWMIWDIDDPRFFYVNGTDILAGTTISNTTLSGFNGIVDMGVTFGNWNAWGWRTGASVPRINYSASAPTSGTPVTGNWVQKTNVTISDLNVNNWYLSTVASDVLAGGPVVSSPASGAITDPAPTLNAFLSTYPAWPGDKTYYEWNIDTVNTFDSVNLIRVVNQGTGQSPVIPTDGTWYLRVRVVNADNVSVTSSWSATNTLTLTRFAVPTPTSVQLVSGTQNSFKSTWQANVAAVANVSAQFYLEFKWTPTAAPDFNNPYKTVTSLPVSNAGGTASVFFDPYPPDTLPTVFWDVRVTQISSQDGRRGSSVTLTAQAISPIAPVAFDNLTTYTPANSSTVASSFPTFVLAGSMPSNMSNVIRRQRPQVQVATDTGFTTGVRTFDIGAFQETNNSGVIKTFTGAASTRLPQGVYYMRFRMTDEYGLASAWYMPSTPSFTISHAPQASPQSPASNSLATYASSLLFSWLFGDSSAGDAQTLAHVVVQRVSDGLIIAQSNQATNWTDQSLSLAIDPSYKGVALTWKVRVADTDGVYGPFSNPIAFQTIDPPGVTINTPVVGSPLTTGRPTVSWTLSGTAAQRSFVVMVQETNTGKVVFQSTGTTATSVSATRTVLQNNTSYLFTVTVTTVLGNTSTSTATVTTSYTAPSAPPFATDASVYSDFGYINVDWSGAAADTYFTQWTVYRQDLALDDDWVVVYSSTNPNVRSYHDWTAVTGHSYIYAVSQLADRFGVLIESPITIPDTFTQPIEGSWWLIDVDNESRNLRLNVKSDSLTDAVEQADYVVIGRGRRKEYGTRIGIDGSLEISMRPDPFMTAAERLSRLRALYARRKTLVLRDAFGNRYNVVLGDISWSHVAGVGSTEMMDVTLPISEVF